MKYFTIEELTLLKNYKTDDIEKTKNEMAKAIPVIDDPDMKALVKNVLDKLSSMTSTEFSQIDFSDAIDTGDVLEPYLL